MKYNFNFVSYKILSDKSSIFFNLFNNSLVNNDKTYIFSLQLSLPRHRRVDLVIVDVGGGESSVPSSTRRRRLQVHPGHEPRPRQKLAPILGLCRAVAGKPSAEKAERRQFPQRLRRLGQWLSSIG